MDRRTFLKSSGAVTVGGLATSASASASLAGTDLDGNARALSLFMKAPRTGLDTALTARRISEAVETATGTRLQFVGTDSPDTADLTLTTAEDHTVRHPAWGAFAPFVHGLPPTDLAAWLTVGGGTPMVELLEAETGEKIFFAGQSHVPAGLWADRELVGMHARPSLTIIANGNTALTTTEAGAGNITLHLSDGLAADMEAGRFETDIYHALPTPLAGTPLVLTLTEDTWASLTEPEQAVIAAILATEDARVASENHAADRMARKALPLPAAVPLPGEFKRAIASAIENERTQLAAASPLAADILASQAGYRTISGVMDLAQASRHYSV